MFPLPALKSLDVQVFEATDGRRPAAYNSAVNSSEASDIWDTGIAE